MNYTFRFNIMTVLRFGLYGRYHSMRTNIVIFLCQSAQRQYKTSVIYHVVFERYCDVYKQTHGNVLEFRNNQIPPAIQGRRGMSECQKGNDKTISLFFKHFLDYFKKLTNIRKNHKKYSLRTILGTIRFYPIKDCIKKVTTDLEFFSYTGTLQ